MHRQPAAGARVAPAISILHAAPFQCGCKAQGAAVASGRPAGTQKGGMHFAAAPAGAYQAPPQRSVYPSLTPICSRSPPARPAQSKRTHAAYAPGCGAGFDTGPGAEAPPICRKTGAALPKLFDPRPRLPGKAVFRQAHKTHFLPSVPCLVISELSSQVQQEAGSKFHQS